MKTVSYDALVETAARLCGEAACDLPPDVLDKLEAVGKIETRELAADFFRQYLENADIAKNERLPLCQDTGFAVWFVELGREVVLDSGDIYAALNAGTELGYQRYYLRKSIVSDPLFDRVNTSNNTPAIIHLKLVPGDQIHLLLAPKGGGSENMSALKMLKPAEGRAGVIDFVVKSVTAAGGNPCPPTVVGVGIGGTMEYACFLAKHALLRKIGEPNADSRYAELEREILERINASGVGAQGLGGDITSLAVHIEYFPCHLASLPVAVNLNCHAARHAEAII